MNNPLPVSAVVITYNEAQRIKKCLDSVAFCDEIIVVDSGSDDDTRTLAASLGAKVIEQDWLGYGRQKDFAVQQAVNDWVLCLDADEQVSAELKENLAACMNAPAFSAYRMPRRNRFLGRWLKHGEGYPDNSLRLFDRRFARWSDDKIHEKVVSDKPVGELAGDLLHESQETIASYLEKQNRYTTLQAQDIARSGKKITVAKLMVNPLVRFVKFYIFKRGFLDGVPGLVHILIGCMNTFLKYAKALELQKE